ncbi:extracellular solute-binding protein [Halarchaeum nitratireducens]|uniref:extracellular solute-binding protein n=1 Tax=Halarchaeum nitratireducens TaxID=489913 RepID=UPI001669E020|nr:extracellular solute-binding protein [Halarchaeum nitratireducens]MBP2252501.1 spermidine/putrescine-binding protein [Halarchaeum solikamskense]
MRRRTVLGSIGAGAIAGLAGCGSSSGDGDEGGTTGGTASSSTGTASGVKDFGGTEISVLLNGGPIQEGFRQIVIPHVEEKYNMTINSSVAFTSEQMSQARSNPNNPPDAFNMDVIGVAAGNREGWLEDLSAHADALANWDSIHPKLRHEDYGHAGVSWQIGEVGPVLNTGTGVWDAGSLPATQDAIFRNCRDVSMTPFSWTNGPYTLLLASTIATDNGKEYFQSSDVDVEAGFEYLRETLARKNTTTITGESQLRNMIGSGNADTIPSIYMFGMIDVWQNVDDVTFARNLDPLSIPIAESLGVAAESDNKEAALAYVNEAFDPEIQRRLSQFMGTGTAVEGVENQPKAREFGAPTPDEFDNLVWPDFDYVSENRSQWSNRWSQIFG